MAAWEATAILCAVLALGLWAYILCPLSLVGVYVVMQVTKARRHREIMDAGEARARERNEWRSRRP